MNILFLIGNGFDKNLNLPTSYSEFYDYYLNKKDNSNPNVEKLKESISEGRDNWSDLEYQLGQYVSNLSEASEINQLHIDIKSNLIEYLKLVTSNITFGETERKKFFNDLIAPETYLEPTDRTEIIAIKNRESIKHIRVITFNYDFIFEILSGYQGTTLKIANSYYDITNLVHIHGTLDHGLILGVNSPEQFHNQPALSNSLIRNKFIKPDYNRITKDGKDALCQKMIMNTDIFYMFGLSIGQTDKRWWEFICKRLKSSKAILIIFWFDKDMKNSEQFIAEVWEKEQEIKEHFLSHGDIDETTKESIKERIFVKINSNFMKIRVEKPKK